MPEFEAAYAELLGIGPGDEVVVTPRSFMASASTVVLRGARAVFAEVDRDTQNITAAASHKGTAANSPVTASQAPTGAMASPRPVPRGRPWPGGRSW